MVDWVLLSRFGLTACVLQSIALQTCVGFNAKRSVRYTAAQAGTRSALQLERCEFRKGNAQAKHSATETLVYWVEKISKL